MTASLPPRRDGPRAVLRVQMQYLLSALVLVLGITMLGLGVHSVIGRPASRVTPRVAAAVSVPAAPPSMPTPAVSASATVDIASQPASPSPSSTAALRGAEDVRFTVASASGKVRCWAQGCWLWAATASASCSQAEARVTIPGASASAVPRTLTQMLGGFVAGEARVIEVDSIGASQDPAVTPVITCLKIDGL